MGGGKPLIKFTRKINVNIDFPEELGFETLNFTIEEDFEEKDDDIISINDIISKIPNDRKQNYIFNNTTDQTTDTREFKGLSFKGNNEIINSTKLIYGKNSQIKREEMLTIGVKFVEH